MSRSTRWILAGLVVAGCQAPPAATPTQTPPVTVAPPVAAAPAADSAATPAANPKAQSVAKLVQAETQAMDATPGARAANVPTDVAVIPPGRAAATAKPPVKVDPAPPAAAPKPPGVAAVEGAIAANASVHAPTARATTDDGFKPVPAIGSVTFDREVAVSPSADPALAVPPVVSPPPTAAVPPVTPPATVEPPVTPPAVASAPPIAPQPPAGAADPLEKRLLDDARAHPRDLAPQVDAQLLLFLKGEKVPTADAMSGLNVEDRDVLTSMLDGLANFRTGIAANKNLLITRKIQPLIEMANRLRSRADMEIVNATFCRTIRGFGNYDPVPNFKLVTGVNSKPKLYFEIDNITPRLDPNNMWVTIMRLDLTLFDANGQVKWNLPNTSVTDQCRNRRQDFFFARVLDFPLSLEPGNYTLKITVTDEVARRVAESGMPITVAPQVNLPGAKPAGPPLRQ